jgi:EmrB/QacA subfamily drug resistance transporter
MIEATRRKALLFLLLFGVLMGALDLAIIGPALPAIQADLGMETRSLAWLFNLYVLGQLVGTPILAKLSDRLGPRPVYIASIVFFAIGSMLMVWGQSPLWLFVGRAVQGFGGGGIFPVAVKVIGDVFPPDKRGGALGLLGAVFGLAFLIGPLLGGLLLDYGWQWLFLINIPIAVLLILGAWQLLPTSTSGKAHKPFDFGGAASLSIGLAALAIAITNFDSGDMLTSIQTLNVWPFLLAFGVLAPVFWQLEKQAGDPIIKPAFFGNSQITVATLITLGLGAMQSATAFYPALAVAALGMTESQASLLLVWGIIVTTIAAPTAGFLVNRFGPRTLVVFGLFFIAAGFFVYGQSSLTTAIFIAASCLAGLGFATALGAPIRIVVLNEVGPEDRGAAQGLLNVSVNIGQLLGAALVGGMTASMGGGAAGYQFSYTVMGVVTAGLLVLAVRLRSKSEQDELTERATAAHSAS